MVTSMLLLLLWRLQGLLLLLLWLAGVACLLLLRVDSGQLPARPPGALRLRCCWWGVCSSLRQHPVGRVKIKPRYALTNAHVIMGTLLRLLQFACPVVLCMDMQPYR